MLKKTLAFALAIGAFFGVALAQTTEASIDNSGIIELVRLGVGEAVILAKLRSAKCVCDTSAAAIAKLKKANVSDAVIVAMISGNTGNPAQKEPEKAVSMSVNDAASVLGKLNEPGIYIVEGETVTLIEPTVFSGTKANFLKGALTYGILKNKFRAKVRGKTANSSAKSPSPTFYFVFNPEYKDSGATMAGSMWWGMPATSPAEFIMVQMDVKESSREVVLGEYGTFSGVSNGARDKDIREYGFEKIKPGIYKVTPKTALANGEYCFYFAGNVVGFGFAGGKIFDFAIAR